MAKNQNDDNTGDDSAKATSKTVDYASQIGGAINKDSAEKLFKGNARMVFDAVATTGGYGAFNDAEYDGGVTLAIPAGNAELRAKINEALKGLE